MGYPKLLLPYKNKSIIQHVIHHALSSNLDGLVVVINPKIEKLYEEVRVNHVNKIILNNLADEGISSSLKAGLQALPKQVEAAVILLGDQPGMSEQVINKVVQQYYENSASIVQAYFQGVKGHPVLFKREMFPYLYQIGGDSGGKNIIKKFADKVDKANIKTPLIPDIDTLDDYHRLISEEVCT